MDYLMVAVKDTCAGIFMNPMYVENEDVAKRTFASQGANINIWKENAKQFELYALGVINKETGIIKGYDQGPLDEPVLHPMYMCNLSDLIG
jgi:hypothetical protein